MNLQKLDKLQSLRRIDLKNEYKAHLWKQNKSYVKYIESLSNHIHEYGLRFIVLWENLDFFLAVKDKYDDIDDAKDFIENCLAELEEENYNPSIHLLYKHIELSVIVANAIKDDENASTLLLCRFIVYASAYDLLFEVVTKVLSGYTFEAAYYEITNKVLPGDIEGVEAAHNLFADYFTFENEEDYKFTPFRLYSTNEYILNYDISALVGIVSDITDANIMIHELIVPSRESKIFEEPELGFASPAKLYEFGDEPYIEYKSFKMEVPKEYLDKEIFVCSVFLDLDDGIIRTISDENEITAEDVAQCIKNLLKTNVYTHPKEEKWGGEHIEISWVEGI